MSVAVAAEHGDGDLFGGRRSPPRGAGTPARRKRVMFSTTTIESSTSRPSAITKPTIDSWLMLKPVQLQHATAIASESGMDTITTMDARQPSGSSVISTSAIAIAKSLAEPVEPRRSRSRDWSKPRSSVTPSGSSSFFCIEHRPDRVAHVARCSCPPVASRSRTSRAARCSGRCARDRHQPHCTVGDITTRTMLPALPAITVSRIWSSVAIASRCREVEATRADIHTSRRGSRVLSLAERSQHLRRRDAERRHAAEIERHLHFTTAVRPSAWPVFTPATRVNALLDALGDDSRARVRSGLARRVRSARSPGGVLVAQHLEALQRRRQRRRANAFTSRTHLVVLAIGVDFGLELDGITESPSLLREYLSSLTFVERVQLASRSAR